MARVTDEDLKQRINAFGGSALVHSPTVGRKKIPNPAHKANGGTSYTVPEEIEVETQRWAGADGATIEAYQIPGTNDWEIEKEQPAPARAPSTARSNPNSPEGRAEAEAERERQWNQANGGLYETHKERRDREAKEAETARQRGRQDEADQRQRDVDARAEADRNKPERRVETININGTRYTQITTIPKDGTKPTIEYQGTDGKPVSSLPIEIKPGQVIKGGGANGEDVQAVTQPDGTIKYQPIQGAAAPASSRPIPADAPLYTPNYDDPRGDLGLTAYQQRLIAWVNAGGSKQIADQLMTNAGGLATQTASHGTTQRSQAATARGQDITQRQQDLSEVESRRTNATTYLQNVLTGFNTGAQKVMGGDEGLAVEAFRAALALGRDNAEAWGGMQNVPQVPPSFVGAMQGTPTTDVAVGPGGQITVSPPGAPPIGAVGAGVTATTAAAANPTRENVDAANGATMAGTNAAMGALGVPPAPTPAPGAPQSSMAPPSFTDPTTGRFGIPGSFSTGPYGGPMVQAIRPAQGMHQPFQPDRAALRARGFTDAEIDEAMAAEGMLV